MIWNWQALPSLDRAFLVTGTLLAVGVVLAMVFGYGRIRGRGTAIKRIAVFAAMAGECFAAAAIVSVIADLVTSRIASSILGWASIASALAGLALAALCATLLFGLGDQNGHTGSV